MKMIKMVKMIGMMKMMHLIKIDFTDVILVREDIRGVIENNKDCEADEDD